MAILRLSPGDIFPWTDKYALVGHYGDATNISKWQRDASERLPVLAGPAGLGPFVTRAAPRRASAPCEDRLGRMANERSTKIRDALRAGDRAALNEALDGLNPVDQKEAVHQARSAVVDEMNDALAEQTKSGSGAAIDPSAWTDELDRLDKLLARY